MDFDTKDTKFAGNAIKKVATGAMASVFAGIFFTANALAASNSVKITVSENQRCIHSNGIADHTTGDFPTAGNPNKISEQDIRLCVPANPVKGAVAKELRGIVGIALNGIVMRPGTADWYDASSPRGHSRDRSSGWNLEGMGAADMLGMDQNNAHVDNRGVYHYHGPSEAIMNSAQGTLVGYAADGHEIHYLGSKIQSSWQLKPGTRPTEPFGAYDGLFEQDWQYVAGSGNLDECNGGTMNGKYVYFATDTFPFFPRCAFGEVSSDFGHPRGPNTNQQAMGEPTSPSLQMGEQPPRRRLGFNQRRPGAAGGRRGPPQMALAACISKTIGSNCSFQSPRGQASGSCVITPDQRKACRPRR